MVSRFFAVLARLLLGAAAHAGRQVADAEQRLAMPARMLEGLRSIASDSAKGLEGSPRRGL